MTVLLVAVTGCASVKNLAVTNDLNQMIQASEILQDQHMGYMLYDPSSGRNLLAINEDKYFTPASNTKLLTLYASLLALGDSVPTFAYQLRGKQLILQPLGDPTFLHPDFESQSTLRSIEAFAADTLLIDWPDEEPARYGPGWSWDDYSYGYQVERTPLPMYGNVLTVTQIDSATVSPAFFADFVDFTQDPEVYRDRYQNIFHLPADTIDGDTVTYRVPIQNNHELTELLLATATGSEVKAYGDGYYYPSDTLYNGPVTPLLALMAQRSDNFLAEQLLHQSAVLSKSASVEEHITKLAMYDMSFLPDSLIWVDGSGLSRYNMITPRNLVALLEKMYQTMDWEALTSLLPAGGVNGTIRSWYGAEPPYVFAKTGTLRHNHCLSGYVETKSGKKLIFSFMNNHFTRPTSDIKREMQRLLETIRDTY